MEDKFIVIAPREFWDQFDERIAKLLGGQEKKSSKWLRSADVRELLNISDSTLQTFRINGTIPAYKLDNMWFYKNDEIVAVLESGRMKGGNND